MERKRQCSTWNIVAKKTKNGIILKKDVPRGTMSPEAGLIYHKKIRSFNMITTAFEGKEVLIEEIIPNRDQPRKYFDSVAIEELAESIKIQGILQPLIVSFDSQFKKFLLIAGERRLRAAKIAGLEKVPVIIKQCEQQEALRIALIENIQRSDLNIIEEAQALRSLMRDYGLSQEDCAKVLGKERSTISNILRMLSLPIEVQEDLISAKITPGHGKAIASLSDRLMMTRARDIVIKRDLSVRKTEALCKAFKIKTERGDDFESSKGDEDANLEYVADSLRTQLRTKVKISGSAERGRIEISFFSGGELARILELMGAQL